MANFKELLLELQDKNNLKLLFEKDHRKNIVNKLNFSQEVADWLHGLSDKYSIWFAKQIKEKGLQERVLAELQDRFEEDFNNIIDWIKGRADERNPIIIKNYDFDSAKEAADEWHENLESKDDEIKIVGVEDDDLKTGTVIAKYDDGWYWINLHKSYCKKERDTMQHCATARSGNTLISLRKSGITKGVTLDIKPDFSIYNQLKGKQNAKPVEKYYPYIIDLFNKLDVPKYDHRWLGSDWTIFDLPIPEANKLLNGPKGKQWHEHLKNIAEKTNANILIYDINDELKAWILNKENRIREEFEENLKFNNINIDPNFTIEYDTDEPDIQEIVREISNHVRANGYKSEIMDDEPGQIGWWYTIDNKFYEYALTGMHILGISFEKIHDGFLVSNLIPNITGDPIEMDVKIKKPGIITGKEIIECFTANRGK